MNETFMLTAFPGVSKPPAQHPIKAELWESDKLYHLTSQLICRAEYEIRRDEARRGELSSPTNSGCTPNIFNQEPDEAFWNPDIVKQEPEEAGIVDQEPEEAGIVSREPDDASWCPTIIKQEPEEAGSYPGVFNQEPIEAPWCPDIKQEPDGASWCSDIAHVEPDKVGRCPDMVRVGTEEAGSCPGVVNVKPDKVGWCPDMVKVGTEEAGSCPGVVNVEPDKVGWSPYIVKVEPEEVGCCPDLIQVKHDRAGCYWDVVKQDPVSRPSGKECDPLAPGPSRGDAGRTDSLAHPALQPSGGQDCVARGHRARLVSERGRLKLELRRIKDEIYRLRSQLGDCERQRRTQSATISNLKLKFAGLERSNLEKEMVRRRARDVLKTAFSENQIASLLDRGRGVVWHDDEMAQAIALRYISKRAYVFLRTKLNYPLPSVAALKKWSSQ